MQEKLKSDLLKILADPFLLEQFKRELANEEQGIHAALWYTLRDANTDAALRQLRADDKRMDNLGKDIARYREEHGMSRQPKDITDLSPNMNSMETEETQRDKEKKLDQAVSKKVSEAKQMSLQNGDHLTTDRSDPALHEVGPNGQNKKYLIMSDEERAKGYTRPYRNAYVHIGAKGPKYPTRDLGTKEYGETSDGFIKYEEYPEGSEEQLKGKIGRYWTQEELDNAGKGCGTRTFMGEKLSETYAVNPKFYGATFCAGCKKHLPVAEFVWDSTDVRVGE